MSGYSKKSRHFFFNLLTKKFIQFTLRRFFCCTMTFSLPFKPPNFYLNLIWKFWTIIYFLNSRFHILIILATINNHSIIIPIKILIHLNHIKNCIFVFPRTANTKLIFRFIKFNILISFTTFISYPR